MGKGVTREDQLLALCEYMQDHVYFKPERKKFYAPPEHSILYRMWRQGKLTRRQCVAANVVYMDVLNAYGNSKGNTSSYEHRVDVSRGREGFSPTLVENIHQQRFAGLVEYLHPHERLNLVVLIREFDRTSKVKVDLRAFGSNMSGYNDGAQANAAGTAVFQTLLTSCAEYYNINDKDFPIDWS